MSLSDLARRIFSAAAASYRATPLHQSNKLGGAQQSQVTMSLSHLFKSRLAFSTLRNQEGGIFSAFYKATRVLQRSLASEVGGKKGSCFPNSYSDAIYNDASILLIASPLCASSLMLALLARDKYIEFDCEMWCLEINEGKILYSVQECEFKELKRSCAKYVPLFAWLSPFYY